MRYYSIESKTDYHGHRYRFRSLYNSCVGSWCREREDVIKQGEDHKTHQYIKYLLP